MSAASSRPSPRTLAARAGVESDAQHGAVMPPLSLSVNFAFESLGAKRRYDYTRSGNPTRDQFGDAVSALEGGAGAVITSSGLAALALALQLVRPGERVVAPHDGYGGTWRLLDAWSARGAFDVAFVDQRDPAALAAALPGARLVLVETPSNPLLRVTDIAAVVRAVQAHAARVGERRALVCADNTFLSPLRQRPLELGADLVLHSTTKYLNGHSDVVGGALVARDEELLRELTWWGNAIGLTGAPFDAWLALRGLRTLAVRLDAQEASAQRIARRLRAHPAVRAVHYPGIAAHPDHALAARQQSGPGAMLSFELAGGQTAARRCVEGLACFSLAESLGGVESLVAHPATMTHAAMSAAARARAGIGEGLLRLSIGLEDPADLWADLERGLARSAGAGNGFEAERAPSGIAIS